MSEGEMGNMRFNYQPEEAKGLFTFLWEKYLVEHHDGDKYQAMQSSTYQFVNFCEQYLSDRRPSLTFVAHANVGIYLADGTRLVIAPPVADAPRGDMAPTVTPNQGAVMISGNAKKQPGMQDMRQYDKRTFELAEGRGTDATLQNRPEKLDQDKPYIRERR